MNPSANRGETNAMTAYPASSVPITLLSRKYEEIPTPTPKTEKTNCLEDKEKNSFG